MSKIIYMIMLLVLVVMQALSIRKINKNKRKIERMGIYMIEEFNKKYKQALTPIYCSNCHCMLGMVSGTYNLRCGKCKKHPIIYGNTEKKEQYIKE